MIHINRKSIKNNVTAAAAPAVTDDMGDGYSVGSMWVDLLGDKVYICVDKTIGAAVWNECGGTGGGGSGSGYQDYIGSPMIITGGEITDGTNAGTFQVSALTALLRSTDSATGELTYVTKTAEDNISITLADTLYYVALNYNAGSPTISLITTLGVFNDKISLGSVMKDASNSVHYISGCHRLQDGVSKLHFRAFELYGLYLTEGNAIAYSGTNNFTLTAGVVYEGINRLTQIAYDSSATTFTPVYQNGAGGWTEGAARNTIDYAHYDDGDGTLGEVGVNKYSVHWVFRQIDGDAAVYVLYDRGSYTLAEAEVTDVPTKPDHLTNFSCLIGRIVAPQAGGSFTTVDMVTDTVFIGQAVATHNDLGGLNEGDYKHLTAAEKTSFDAGDIVKDLTPQLGGDLDCNGHAVLESAGISLLNDDWLSGKNYAGTGNINMLKVTVDDEVNIGATLITGPTEAEEDSGAITIMDMPVSATPTAGTQMSYTFKIDGDNILTIYSEANSAGSIQNPGVVTECQINLKEITTPTAKANYGALYTKADNNLYFQDGAGVEHTVTIS